MTDINAVASQLSQLKLRLDQAQLTHRDASLKSRREIAILKRLISRLSVACRGLDLELDEKLGMLRQDLEQQKDISLLIPRIAVVERLANRMGDAHPKERELLDKQFQRNSEILRRFPGLPAQLKRDLHQLLSQPATTLSGLLQHVLGLMSLYERALKLVATKGLQNNPAAIQQDLLMKLTAELQHLITELDFDGEAGDKLLTIRNQLLKGVLPSELLTIALEVLRLVLAGTHQERQASQQFLDSVNGELGTLCKTTQQSAEQSHTIYEHRGEMTDELAELAQSIKSGLQTHKQLDSWRPELTHLTKELLVLAERNKALEKREKALLEQLSYNKSKIEHLYDQTMDYRQRLTDQEQRIFLDNLTKVYNRTALNDRLEHEYRRWLRYQHPLCVTLVDIDNFSTVNQQYGHQAGDKILKIIARTIRKQLEPTDFIGRFGDDAFMLILPDVSEEQRNLRLTAIRQAIAQLPFRFRDNNIAITVSMGATLFESNDTPTDIIERTDKALTGARSAGSNRIFWIF